MTRLYPYQVAGGKWLAQRKVALLADGCRVGKTGALIAGADEILADDVLWLTKGTARPDHARAWRRFQTLGRPITAIYSGKDEIPPDGVIITTYDLAGGALLDRLMARRFDLLVTDEDHKLKTRDARRTRAVYGEKLDRSTALAGRAEFVWGASATPAPNNQSEFYARLRSLAPERILNPKSGKPYAYGQFVSKFCKLKHNGFGYKIVGAKNVDDLKERLEGFMLRRTLEEVQPDMPPLRYDKLPLEGTLRIPPELAPEAAMVARVLAAEGFDGLRKVAGQVSRLRRFTGLAKVDAMAVWVAEALDEGMEKIVLFAYHTAVIEGLRDALRAHGIRAEAVHGKTSAAAAESVHHRFQHGDLQVAIGQIEVWGEAIDLSAANEAILVEPSWVPKDNEQAAHRIVNPEKKVSTLARFAVIPGSIDEDIVRAAGRKSADLSALLD